MASVKSLYEAKPRATVLTAHELKFSDIEPSVRRVIENECIVPGVLTWYEVSDGSYLGHDPSESTNDVAYDDENLRVVYQSTDGEWFANDDVPVDQKKFNSISELI